MWKDCLAPPRACLAEGSQYPPMDIKTRSYITRIVQFHLVMLDFRWERGTLVLHGSFVICEHQEQEL